MITVSVSGAGVKVSDYPGFTLSPGNLKPVAG